MKKILVGIAVLVILILVTTIYFFQNKSNIVWIDYSEDMVFKVEEVVSGLGVPWGMDLLDEGNIIFTERAGNIGVIDLENAKYKLINKPPNVYLGTECGLLDVKVSPSFSKNKNVFFTYAKRINGNGYTSIAIATVINHQIHNWKDIFVSKHEPTSSPGHCGSRITFDNDGHLFASIGDRGFRSGAQDTSTHVGSIIRLNLDGSIPLDNPYVTSEGALPEIWSIGHRNPQGLYYDSSNKRLWSNEHGPKGGDEINLIKPGHNYGWPVITYGTEYAGPPIGEGVEKPGIERPHKIWSPAIAPSSILYYTGASLAGWNRNLFSTSLRGHHLNRLVIDSTGRVILEERLLEEMQERFRAILQDKVGNLYVSTDSGRILKISPVDNPTDIENYYQWELSQDIDRPGMYFGFNFNFMYSFGDPADK